MTADGTSEDVLVIGGHVYVAAGAAGVAVYPNGNIANRLLFDTPICAKHLAYMGNHLAVADIGGIEVFAIEPDGTLTRVAGLSHAETAERLGKSIGSVNGLVDRALTGPEPYAQIPELAERGRKRVLQCFCRLNEHLAGSTFIAGDNYSIADISAMVLVDFAGWIKIAIPDDASHLKRWYGEVSKRPSAAA